MLLVTLSVQTLAWAAPEDYTLSQASGRCAARLVQAETSLSASDAFPLNDTDTEVRTVTVRLALVNTGWAPVRTPWIVSLVNPGYLDAYGHENFTLATAVEHGYKSSHLAFYVLRPRGLATSLS